MENGFQLISWNNPKFSKPQGYYFVKLKQKVAYIQIGGRRCLHCESDKILATPMYSVEINIYYQNVSCDGCGKNWVDVYKLYDVLPGESE